MLYMEFRSSEKKTLQYMVIPEAISPVTNSVVPARLLFRQIDARNPQKGWRAKPSAITSEADGIGGISLAASQALALSDGLAIMTSIAQLITQTGLSDWSLFKMPLAVQITSEDVMFFEKAETPKALIRRVNAARMDAGFGKELFQS